MTGARPALTVIGGYLGAGKTTLVNAILAQAGGLRIAVIVNDFGAINIDAGLIRAQDGDTICLTNGCMCCAASDGMAAALARLLERQPPFDHVVIETSGVAEPGKVARNAHGFRLPLNGVLVLADAEQVRAQAENRYVGDVVKRQLQQADLILLNKTDLVAPEALTDLRGFLDEAAPGVAVAATVSAQMPLAAVLGLARTDARDHRETHDHAGHAHHDHGTTYRSWLVAPDAPMTRAEVEQMAATLTAQAIRAKGHVLVQDDPGIRQLYQQVGRRWTLVPDGPWTEPRPRTRIVAIGLASAPAPAVTAAPAC